MYRVLYRTYNEIVADTVTSIEFEMGDNQIGLIGLIMFPEDNDNAVYVYIPEEERNSIMPLLGHAVTNGYVDLTQFASIQSEDDKWSFSQADIDGLNSLVGTSFSRTCDFNPNLEKDLIEAVSHMV